MEKTLEKIWKTLRILPVHNKYYIELLLEAVVVIGLDALILF